VSQQEQPKTPEQQMETALAVVPKDKTAIALGERGLAFENAGELYRMSDAFVKGGVAPRGTTAGGAMAALLKGRALGLDEVTALTNITVVNGRVTIGGSLILALVRKHHACAELAYRWEGEGNTRAAIIRARRIDERDATETRFGWDDAVRAGLASKDCYRAYPDDMLLWRAAARMGRRQFPDILAGCYVPGEIVEVEAPGPAAPPPTDEPPPQDPLLAELSGDPADDSEPDITDAIPSRAVAQMCGVSHTFVDQSRPVEVATVATCGNSLHAGRDGKAYPARRVVPEREAPAYEEPVIERPKLGSPAVEPEQGVSQADTPGGPPAPPEPARRTEPPAEPPPFESHAEADRAIAEADARQAGLFPEPAAPRRRRALQE
jgi:hypothetical protein